MLFFVTIEVRYLGHVFPNPAVSASSRGEASVFLTLVLLLIQMSMLFLFSLSLFIGGLAASSEQRVRRLRCRKQ